jgi:hypothetical protein
MDNASVLPGTSFVPFTAYRVARPTAAWRNDEATQMADPLEHAFCLPLDGEPTSVCPDQPKTYYAERYGGRGMSGNGGAGRCGTLGAVQIKGVGRTPLVGPGGDAEHSYGGASLQEAVREALGGEVCQIALPFGSVRVLGIILTDTQVPNFWPGDTGAEATPRALIVREAAIRPAHFMRASHFRLQGRLAVTDVQRVRAAVACLPGVARNLFDGSPETSRGSLGLRDCLMEMSRRFGAQLAAAQAKRLVHGALAPQNIALDGRWLDYGTLTPSSDYGRLWVSRGNPADSWRQFTCLLDTFYGLAFHARKYLMPSAVADLPRAEELVQEYLRTLAARLHCEFAKLTGIPETVLRGVSPAPLERFCACVQKIIARGNRIPFVPYADMPVRMGQFHLNTLLREAGLCGGPEEMDVALAPCLSDMSLRKELVESYWPLRAAYAQASAGLPDNGHTYLALNAIRVNTVVEELLRPKLDKRIDELVASGRSVSDFIASLVKEAKTFLADPIDDFIRLDALLDGRAALSVSRRSAAERHEELGRVLRALAMRRFDCGEQRRERSACT